MFDKEYHTVRTLHALAVVVIFLLMMVAKRFLPDGYDLAIFIAFAAGATLSWFLIKARVRRHFHGG